MSCLDQLVVSQNYKVLCPEVLYKPCDECKVFPRMQLDPVDQKHIYVPFEKKVLSFFSVYVHACAFLRGVVH